MSKWENDENLPDILTLPKLCEVLGLFSADGLRVCTKNGIALVISGKEAMQAVFSADFSTVSRISALLSDEAVLKILRALSFSKGKSEGELAAEAGVDAEAVGPVLFRLMKSGFVECVPAEFDPGDGESSDRFLFGVYAYALAAVLAGMFLAGPGGHRVVNGVSRFFSPEQE